MKELISLLENEVKGAFKEAGYDEKYGTVTISNRPDLCEFQCNGAMASAKEYHKAPIEIAKNVAEKLTGSSLISDIDAVPPGFLNFRVSADDLSKYINDMASSDSLGYEKTGDQKTIILDYGGPNVAKPLHVGHLRSAVIGEALKRILRFNGDRVVADVHLGDWGLQMGLIITELRERKPDLPYFDESFSGEYPEEAPFTLAELEEIYPTASAKSKDKDNPEAAAEYKARALEATAELQKGNPAYRAILKHIIDLSVTDLKKNYERLSVDFDLWKGESDADPFIPDMVRMMKDGGWAHESDGALVVDVAEESDSREIPPCMILKSDGAALYDTTDLATLVWRERDYHPDMVAYVVDKRQELHFIQVFRCAKKTGIVPEDTDLRFVGFGTMNGADGKPFKTRDGGVMRLSSLLDEITAGMKEKIRSGGVLDGDEADKVAAQVALSAIKYGDLSNQCAKDYVFDVDRFTSFEGNTGPYILYTMVRIKSILSKFESEGGKLESVSVLSPETESERNLMLCISRFQDAVKSAAEELAPHKICAFIYDLSNALNHFYHETRILAEENTEKKLGYLSLLSVTLKVLETSIDMLGFDAPDRM